jgi:hypothetical protein
MNENITTIKVIREEDYEVDINMLARDMADYLKEALCEQFPFDEVEEILEDKENWKPLLAKVGKVWQNEF